jgi:phage replication initiation protein
VHTEAKATLGHLLYHLERCYGKTIHHALASTGVSNADLIDEMRVIGIPRRVDAASATAGLQWPELQAQLQRCRA